MNTLTTKITKLLHKFQESILFWGKDYFFVGGVGESKPFQGGYRKWKVPNDFLYQISLIFVTND